MKSLNYSTAECHLTQPAGDFPMEYQSRSEHTLYYTEVIFLSEGFCNVLCCVMCHKTET